MDRVGVCDQCGFDWSTRPVAILGHLEGLAAEYRAALDLIEATTGPDGARTRPRPAVWSPLEYAAHVRDVLRFYCDRFEKIIQLERPRLHVAGFPAMVNDGRYREEMVDSIVDDLLSEAAAVCALLAGLDESQWARVGIGSDGDERSLLDLARRVAHEGLHHLRDVRNAIGHPDANT